MAALALNGSSVSAQCHGKTRSSLAVGPGESLAGWALSGPGLSRMSAGRLWSPFKDALEILFGVWRHCLLESEQRAGAAPQGAVPHVVFFFLINLFFIFDGVGSLLLCTGFL